MYNEDKDYCELIYEDFYEDGVSRFNDLSDHEFKKLIRTHFNYIKKIAKEGFYKNQFHTFNMELIFCNTVGVPPLASFEALTHRYTIINDCYQIYSGHCIFTIKNGNNRHIKTEGLPPVQNLKLKINLH